MFLVLKKKKILHRTLLSVLLMLLIPLLGQAAPGPVFPFLEGFNFREVPLAESLAVKVPQVRQENSEAPGWKQSWDEARRLAVAGDLSKSAHAYRALLEDKDIIEARWEMVTILLALGRRAEAMDDIESLCEDAPTHPEYLRALAVANLSLGRFKAGAEAYRRLLAVEPENENDQAGLVYSLLAGEEKEEAMARLSILVQHVPQRVDLREALATLAYETLEYDLAWPYLFELSESPEPSPALLRMAAKVSEAREHPEQAAAYWQRYSVLRPDDIEAREWLAEYYSRKGKTREALSHLEVIRRLRSEDLSVLKRVGLDYLKIQDYGKAAAALSQYVLFGVEDKEAAWGLVVARQQLGNTTDTLRALDHYLSLDPHPELAILELAARLYGSLAAHNQAAAVYRRLLVVQPGNQDKLEALVKHLEAAGRDEEALAIWRQLTWISPTSLDYWRSLVKVLERLGQTEELYESLAKLHQLEPADIALGIRLLAYYAAGSDVERGLALVAEMEGMSVPLPAVFHYWRGALRMQRGDYAAALRDLEHFLSHSPQSEEAHLLALKAAGRLGDIARVHAHHQALVRGENIRSVAVLVSVAQAYADCRAESEARSVLLKIAGSEGVDVPDEERKKAYSGLAESFAREHRFYEAEESLRVGLVESGDRVFFLPRLVDLALLGGQVAEASEWLEGLRLILGDTSRRFALLDATVLVARGESRKARKILSSIEGDLSREAEGADVVRERLLAASLWINTTKPQKAILLCRQVLDLDPDNLEALVLLEKANVERDPDTKLIDLAGLRFDQLCDLSEVYSRYGMTRRMAEAARQALVQRPDSLKAGLLLAQAFEAQGLVDAALRQMEQTSAANPDNFSLKVGVASMQFMRGETALIETLANSAQGHDRPDLLLLRARVLWRMNRWEEALQVYRDFLSPRVADELREASHKYGVTLPGGMRSRTVWEVLTRDPGPDQDVVFADHVMNPTNMLSFLDQGAMDFAEAGARLVATYRWQTQFAMEYAPRQSVVRKEYTIAKKQYDALLARYPQERLLLYDLAGMYSALGDLGDEAAAYSALKGAGFEFPELEEAVARNQLKQQPKATLEYGYQSEAGRDGYVDRDKNWLGMSFWNSFKPLHDGELTLQRINYQAGSSNAVVRATRAMGGYSAGLLSGLKVLGSVGVQSSDSTDRQEFVAKASVVGKVGEGLTGIFSYGRDVMDDTTASLLRNILRQDLQGGITLEPLPRLAVGGGYLARDYSDNNWTAGYDLWASYLIVAEPTFLQLKYSYDFKESREGSLLGGSSDGGVFSVMDHPYWAPKNYWLNQVGLFFKHSLVGDPLGREAPQYYTLEYLVGHDGDGYVAQTAKASLVAECSDNFLIEAGTELSNSQSFRRQEYRVGISYRW